MRDKRVLNKYLSKNIRRIFKRNIDQSLILRLSPLSVHEYANIDLTHTFTNERY